MIGNDVYYYYHINQIDSYDLNKGKDNDDNDN